MASPPRVVTPMNPMSPVASPVNPLHLDEKGWEREVQPLKLNKDTKRFIELYITARY